MIEVQLEGLEIFGRHGVLPEEREQGQTFLVDVKLGVGHAGLSDRVEDAVDYREVAAVVQEVSDERTFNLLEAFADAVAGRLHQRFAVGSVYVRVRKPDVRRFGVEAEHAAAVAWRPSR